MKNTILFTVMLILAGLLNAQTSDWQWAKGAGGNKADFAKKITTDIEGNIYALGGFVSKSINFDSIVLNNTDSTANTGDIFLVKYTAYGSVIWVKSIGGSDYDKGFDLNVDISGSVYLSGWSKSSCILLGSDTFYTNGNCNAFLLKYDSDGNVIWSRLFEGDYSGVASSIASDSGGNLYITGYFTSGYIVFGSDTLFSTDNTCASNMFIVKIDSGGDVVWAKSSNGQDHCTAIKVTINENGELYVTGTFRTVSLTLGATTLNPIGSDIFIVKYNVYGDEIWATSISGKGEKHINAIVADNYGNVYVAGYFRDSTIYFGNISLNCLSNNDGFIAKYNTNGDALWAKSVGGSSGDNCRDIQIDFNDGIYVAGEFSGPSITIDTVTLLHSFTTSQPDIFLSKFNADGSISWAMSVKGSGSEACESINVSNTGDVYLAGFFNSSPVYFGSDTLDNNGYNDMFIAKMGDSPSGFYDFESPDLGIAIYPNPFTNLINITTDKPFEYKIIDYAGREISSGLVERSITTSELAIGSYILTIKSDNIFYTRKVVKQ